MDKLIILILVILLTGCGVVTAEDYRKAVIVCEHFDGVDKVWLRGMEVQCKDGTKIEILGSFD